MINHTNDIQHVVNLPARGNAMRLWNWAQITAVCTAISFIQGISCFGQLSVPAISEQDAPADRRKPASSIPAILKNMPMNSDQRCVGIAAVSEALLDGEPVAKAGRPENINALAQEIHKSLTTENQIPFPSHLILNGRRVAITDQEALNSLSSLVAILYKIEHAKRLQTQDGIKKLLEAEKSVIRTTRELDRILDADRDHIDFFCCFGSRRFPDNTYRMSYHAVLIEKLPQGTKVVYDPNAPGAPIQCKFSEENRALTIEWTCKYQDTGLITTQRYQVVPKNRFFRVARGFEPVESGK